MRRMISIRLALIGILTGAMIFHASGNTILIDSLRRVIASQPDSKEKADNLNSMAQEYYNRYEYDSAIFYCEIARKMSVRLSYGEGTAQAYFMQSKSYDKKSDFNEALASARKLLNVTLTLNDSLWLGKSYFQYGHSLHQQGQTDSATAYLRKCLEISVAFQDTGKMMAVCNAIGNMFQDISEFDSAAYYYLWTVDLLEKSGNIQHLAKLYNNLGKTFTRMEKYEDAAKYLEMALKQNENNDDDYTTGLILINTGNNYLRSRDPDMALVFYDKAKEILSQFGEIIDFADLYINYGIVYKMKGKYQPALESFNKALEFYTGQKYAEGMSIALKNIGEIYTAQGKYERAYIVLDSGLSIATRAGYQQNQRDILGALAINAEKTGDYRKAYEYGTMQYELHQDIFNLEKDKMVQDLKLKYEKEVDQSEILALKNSKLEMELELKKKTNQRNGYLYTAVGIIILGLFVLLYLRQRVTIARQKILQLEEEKKLMAAQLLVEGQEQERKRIARELHDGLGVLLSATKMQFTSIKDAGPENQPLIEKATQLLEQATGDVRKISHNMMPGSLTKLGLYEAVEDLFDSINDAEDIHAVCEISGDPVRMPENKEIMLYRILQELVNNTLKHAEAKNVSLKIKAFQGFLQVKFSDDGIGFDVKTMFHPHTESFGLKNLQSRVGFLNGEMDVNSKPGEGVEYIIQVPV